MTCSHFWDCAGSHGKQMKRENYWKKLGCVQSWFFKTIKSNFWGHINKNKHHFMLTYWMFQMPWVGTIFSGIGQSSLSASDGDCWGSEIPVQGFGTGYWWEHAQDLLWVDACSRQGLQYLFLYFESKFLFFCLRIWVSIIEWKTQSSGYKF